MISCRIEVRVTPRSSRNKIAVEGDEVKIWVTAAPTDGQANAAVLSTLSKALGIAPSKLEIIRGDVARNKVVSVEGLSRDTVLARLTDDS